MKISLERRSCRSKIFDLSDNERFKKITGFLKEVQMQQKFVLFVVIVEVDFHDQFQPT